MVATWACGLICGTPSQNRSQPIENCERRENPLPTPPSERLLPAVYGCFVLRVYGCFRLFTAVSGYLRLFRTARFRLARAPVSGFLTNPTCGGHQAAVCEEALQMHDQRVSLKFMRVWGGGRGDVLGICIYFCVHETAPNFWPCATHLLEPICGPLIHATMRCFGPATRQGGPPPQKISALSQRPQDNSAS